MAASPSLEGRVAALEAALSASIQPDTFASSAGQVIDAQGRVTYDFDGHVKARGLDLLAAGAGAPPDDRKVRWLRESDGVLVADLWATYDPGPFPATAQLVVHDGAASARLRAIADAVTPNLTRAIAETTGKARTIIADDGASDFVVGRGCHAFLFSNAATNIANNATAQIAMQAVVYDVTDADDGVGGFLTQKVGNVFTCRRAGLYLALVNGQGPAGGFGSTYNMRHNGGVTVAHAIGAGTGSAFFFRILSLAVGDTVDVTAQNVTGAAGNFTSWLMISRIGALSWL